MIKSIKKIEYFPEEETDEAKFVFQAEKVQGAQVGKIDGAMLIISPRRFKLFTESADFVKIIEAPRGGHFKWSRGETDFRAGDKFEISAVGEYEFTGEGKFLVVRK